MAQHVQVRVVNRYGEPMRDERVSIFAAKQVAAVPIPDQSTDADGVAEFDFAVEGDPEVIVYVRGRECFAQAPVQPRYDVAL